MTQGPGSGGQWDCLFSVFPSWAWNSSAVWSSSFKPFQVTTYQGPTICKARVNQCLLSSHCVRKGKLPLESQIKCKPLSYMLSHVRGKGFPACQWKRRKTHGLWVQPLSQEDPLEEGMATHSSILAWRIPWTEEPGGLQSTGVTKSRTHLMRQSTQGEKWLLIFRIKKEGVFVKRESPKILLLRGWFSTFSQKLWTKDVVSHGSVPFASVQFLFQK